MEFFISIILIYLIYCVALRSLRVLLPALDWLFEWSAQGSLIAVAWIWRAIRRGFNAARNAIGTRNRP